MTKVKEKESWQQKILLHLKKKAGCRFTQIERMLLTFLLFYVLAAIAIFAIFVWEIGVLLPGASCYLLPLLIVWTIFAVGYGTFMLHTIFNKHIWREYDSVNRETDCSNNHRLEPSQRNEEHEEM